MASFTIYSNCFVWVVISLTRITSLWYSFFPGEWMGDS